MRLIRRDELAVDVLDAARLLLGATIVSTSPDGEVAARIVEVEAYRGADDPASHSYRGMTPRNAVMWGPAGHLYVYFVYGMHWCANVVCLDDGVPGAVLLRAGEVVAGTDLARRRRPAVTRESELAKGPARLATVLALGREHDGVDVTDPASPVRIHAADTPAVDVATGPRVGVAVAMDTPWRFWLPGSPAVSPYRRGGKSARAARGATGRAAPERARGEHTP